MPENNPDIFLVLNFNILHFTVIERRSRIHACPHSSERLILGVGYSYIFYPHAFLKKQRGYCNCLSPSVCPSVRYAISS